jgi:hypothetical protein
MQFFPSPGQSFALVQQGIESPVPCRDISYFLFSMAATGHFFIQRPQDMQSSEMI